MEIWDAYNADFTVIKGQTLVRGKPIPEGVYHLACDILVKHADSTYLLMQRDVRKRHGGMWEASAGGSALQGEVPVACAIRELQEETGIVASNATELGRIIHHGHHTVYVIYLVLTDIDKESVTLQKGETQAYQWVSQDTLLSMSQNRELSSNRVCLFI